MDFRLILFKLPKKLMKILCFGLWAALEKYLECRQKFEDTLSR